MIKKNELVFIKNNYEWHQNYDGYETQQETFGPFVAISDFDMNIAFNSYQAICENDYYPYKKTKHTRGILFNGEPSISDAGFIKWLITSNFLAKMDYQSINIDNNGVEHIEKYNASTDNRTISYTKLTDFYIVVEKSRLQDVLEYGFDAGATVLLDLPHTSKEQVILKVTASEITGNQTDRHFKSLKPITPEEINEVILPKSRGPEI